VMMIATELVANAVRHTGAPVKLRLHRTNGRLVIDVADRDPRTPRLREPDLLEEHHRGLMLVDAFAARWGSRPTADGKVVWAEVAL
jgi:anti-sigma regulatory factor (Ser/Thr protein kinase)